MSLFLRIILGSCGMLLAACFLGCEPLEQALERKDKELLNKLGNQTQGLTPELLTSKFVDSGKFRTFLNGFIEKGNEELTKKYKNLLTQKCKNPDVSMCAADQIILVKSCSDLELNLISIYQDQLADTLDSYLQLNADLWKIVSNEGKIEEVLNGLLFNAGNGKDNWSLNSETNAWVNANNFTKETDALRSLADKKIVINVSDAAKNMAKKAVDDHVARWKTVIKRYAYAFISASLEVPGGSLTAECKAKLKLDVPAYTFFKGNIVPFTELLAHLFDLEIMTGLPPFPG